MNSFSPVTVITRFAPSPTGLLHCGNYRTAIFAYLFAKKFHGTFIVRIEDTDRERSKKEFEENIYEALEWLGLTPDTRFRQSEHFHRHQQELQRLMAEGMAYISKEVPIDAWQRSEVIRFRNPNMVITFDDAIRGQISFDTTELGDFIIAKSETEPIFHFAVVVDDSDAGVTHIIRGEDHISNTPRQILIQKALGYVTPIYVHLPLVLGSDRTKLSKRNGAKGLTQYRNEGFLPEAIINYLALLGWHPKGRQEIFTINELIAEFDIARIQKSAGIFDEVKLRWFNHEHIKRLSLADFTVRLKDFMKRVDIIIPTYFHKVLPLLKERTQTLLEATMALQGEEFSFFADTISYDPTLLLNSAKIDAGTAKKHLLTIHKMLVNVTIETFSTSETIKEVLFEYATEQGMGAVLWPMRVALSGMIKSPDPFTLASILGKEKTLERIAEATKML